MWVHGPERLNEPRLKGARFFKDRYHLVRCRFHPGRIRQMLVVRQTPRHRNVDANVTGFAGGAPLPSVCAHRHDVGGGACVSIEVLVRTEHDALNEDARFGVSLWNGVALARYIDSDYRLLNVSPIVYCLHQEDGH
jgi:hypothetical protein